MMRTFLAILLLAGLATGGGVYYYSTQKASHAGPMFRTVTVNRGELIPTISATGTLQAEERVDVGAQVMGRISEFGIDPSDPEKKKRIDYNSIVHEGTVLAVIDDAVYAAQVDQAKASLLNARADLLQMKAKLNQCKREADRAENLRPKQAISDSDYDLAIANHETAQANVKASEARIKLSEAALKLAKINLDYTIIKSPVEGTIVDRRMDVGQTVVASLNAPSLFLIAKDLRHMEVWASVNEADIGQIKSGMPVRFTVDAFPGETFRGVVKQIRLNATMSQNVVTFTVVISTDNSQNRLMPYLTATVLFEIDHRPNVLLVPNSALRYEPRNDLIAPDARVVRGEEGKEGEEGQLWIVDGQYVRPISVQIGQTDTISTEVRGTAVKEGMEVVVGEMTAVAQSNDLTNPFLPKPPPRGKNGPPGPPP